MADEDVTWEDFASGINLFRVHVFFQKVDYSFKSLLHGYVSCYILLVITIYEIVVCCHS